MDYEKLCEESHQISKDKGWLDTPRSFDGDIALMHEELSEALGDYRDHKGLNEIYYEAKVKLGNTGMVREQKVSAEELLQLKQVGKGLFEHDDFLGAKPCGIPIELADLVIRIAQHCGSNDVDLAEAIREIELKDKWGDEWLGNFETFIRRCHQVLAKVEEDNCALGLGDVVLFVRAFCEKHAINLEEAISLKAAFNRTRPHRHGGRKI